MSVQLICVILQMMMSHQALAFIPHSTTRTIHTFGRKDIDVYPTKAHLNMLPPSSIETTFLQAVETFDGSTIADPVVVSSVFWSSITTKIISVIIGQILATIVFSILTYAVSSQLKSLGDIVSKNVFKEMDNGKSNYNDGGGQENMSFQSSSPTTTSSAGTGGVKRTVIPDFSKLLVCIIIDIIGTSSELIPVLGEVTDVVWAPIAALTLRNLFEGSNVIFALEFIEEILPFTDVLPLATICWAIETFADEGEVAKVLQIGAYGPKRVVDKNDDSIVDVESKRFENR